MNGIQDAPFRTPNAHSGYSGYGRPRLTVCEILKIHEKPPDSTTLLYHRMAHPLKIRTLPPKIENRVFYTERAFFRALGILERGWLFAVDVTRCSVHWGEAY